MEFLTVAEVAALLRVSKMTVYRLVRSGEMRSTRIGGSFRVPADAYDEYVTANTSGGPETAEPTAQ